MRQKQRKLTKNIGVCVIHLKLLPLAQLHIIWKWVHPFHSNQPPKFLVEVKKFGKVSFQVTFLNQKRRSATKKIGVCLIHLESLPLAELHIIWKQVHSFHSKQSKKFLLEVKNSENLGFQATFLTQKQRSASKKIGVSLIHLESLPLPQLYIILKWVHPFRSTQPPKLLLNVKNLRKSTFLGHFSE